MNRLILHVDMNAYFASVEVKADPRLKGKPLVIVGDLHRRSVILTSSYEARAYGIRTGMLLHEAQSLCPRVISRVGDHQKYRKLSDEILRLLLTFTDQVEMTSCDEAFLDMTGNASAFDGAERLAILVHDKIGSALGLPCSVGAAPNKLLAKLASDMKKPDGITVIRPEGVPATLENLPVQSLCGIGRKTAAALKEMGILTTGELGRAAEQRLYTRFGVGGHWLKRMGQGLDDDPVRGPEDTETVKSVGNSTTFPKDTRDPDTLKSYMFLLSEKVGFRLRKAGLKGRTVSLTLRYSDFRFVSKQTRLQEPTDDDVEIYRVGEKLLKGFGPLPKAVRLAGITVAELSGESGQSFLFDNFEKRNRLSKTVDSLNRKYGKWTIRHARVERARKSGVFEPPIPPRHTPSAG